jgi:hypothetical protein
VPAKSVARPSLGNASKLIPPSEFDEEPGKRCALPSESDEELGKKCALPSSQMGRREISKFPLDGVSRPKTPSEVAPLLLNTM